MIFDTSGFYGSYSENMKLTQTEQKYATDADNYMEVMKFWCC